MEQIFIMIAYKKFIKNVCTALYCGKVSLCWCFTDIDEAINDEAMMYDTNRCFVLDTDGAKEIGKEMGITVKSTMEEWNAGKIVKVMIEDINADFEYINGEACEPQGQ